MTKATREILWKPQTFSRDVCSRIVVIMADDRKSRSSEILAQANLAAYNLLQGSCLPLNSSCHVLLV